MVMLNNIFKRNKRQQNCLILTEDGRIVDTALPVEKGYIVDHKTMEAWGLFPDCCIPQEGGKSLFQVMCERDATPIPVSGNTSNKITQKIVSQIAEEHVDQSLAHIARKSLKNKMADTLRTVILIFAILVAGMVVFGLVTTGKLHMPSF